MIQTAIHWKELLTRIRRRAGVYAKVGDGWSTRLSIGGPWHPAVAVPARRRLVDDHDKRRSLYTLVAFWLHFALLLSSPFAQSPSSPLSKEDVFQLLNGGVSAKRISIIVEERKINFEMDAAVETQLKHAGATDTLIETLWRRAPKSSQAVLPSGTNTIHPASEEASASVPPTVQLEDSDAEAKRALKDALSALTAKKYEEAVTLFGRAARDKPGWGEPLVERAKLEAKLGRFTDAIEDCSEALRLNPDDAIALYFRGFAKYQLNRNDEAIADFNKALRLNPDYHEAYKNRGNAKWAIGDKTGANSDFAMARSLQGGKR